MVGRGSVAAVVLASGEARRFGGRKQLALLEGRTLLEHVLELARAARLRPIVAVVPIWLTRPAALEDTDELIWVRNANPQLGMSHSLRLGFAALPDTAEAAVVLLGDQPRVPLQHLGALVIARGRRPVVASAVGERLTVPVLVERPLFPLIQELRGDIGLRDVLEARRTEIEAVPLAQGIVDVDTPADLERLRGD